MLKRRNNTFLMTKEKFRKMIFSIGTLFCMAPLYDFENETLKYLKLNKAYAILHVILHTISAAINKSPNFQRTETEVPLDTIGNIINEGLMCTLTYNILFINSQKWKVYLQKLIQINMERNKKCQYQVNLFHLQFFCGHLIFVGVYVYACIKFEHQSAPNAYTLLTFILDEIIPEYYYLLASLILSYLLVIIKFGYLSLCQDLEEFCNNKYALKNESLTLNKISQISRLYKRTTELTKVYNKMEGWKIAFLFLHTILRILKAANWFMLLPTRFILHFENCLVIFLITLLALVS